MHENRDIGCTGDEAGVVQLSTYETSRSTRVAAVRPSARATLDFNSEREGAGCLFGLDGTTLADKGRTHRLY